MLALSIRQPFAELILRGLKTVEFRSRPTRIIGERFYIYASARKWPWAGERGAVIRADNIVVPDEPLPPWMVELAEALRLFPHDLPRGVIVGSAVIDRCDPAGPREDLLSDSLYQWHLSDVQRLSRPRKPQRQPQPVWFKPF